MFMILMRIWQTLNMRNLLAASQIIYNRWSVCCTSFKHVGKVTARNILQHWMNRSNTAHDLYKYAQLIPLHLAQMNVED